MPSKSKDGVRQRKKNSSNGEGDASEPTLKQLPKPVSGGGMTCMNWFIVLVLILGASGGAGFFIYNEMRITNRALSQEVQALKSRSSGASDFSEQIKEISTKLETLEKIKADIESVKQADESRAGEFSQLTSQMEKSQHEMKDLSRKLTESVTVIDNLKRDVDKVQSTQESQSKVSEKTDSELKKINAQFEVTNTNIASLTDELMRLDKQSKVNSDQISSVQKEVIDLTADKVQMSSAIDSIKSTVVSIRVAAQKAQEQQPQDGAQADTEAIQQKIQEMDSRMAGEVERLSRQISETSENSAKWLQQASNEIGERFQRSLEDMNKKLSEVQAKASQPAQASEDQSIVNSIAAFEARLNEMSQSIAKANKLILGVDVERKKTAKLSEDQLVGHKDSIVALAQKLNEAKTKDGKLETAIKDLTLQVTTLSNELNGIRTTARHLESRVEEIKSKRVEEPPKPAEPDRPDAPESQ